jgi:hypothetical protein
MKVIAEFDETQYGLLCKPDEVKPLFKALSELESKLWCEAFYDPYNEHTRKFAKELMPFMDEVKKILQFKK